MKRLYFLTVGMVFVLSLAVAAQHTEEVSSKALELLTRGDFRGALAVLDKDVAGNKNLFRSYKLRGSIKKMIGNFAGALEDFDKAIELNSSDGELYQERAMVRLFTNQDPTMILNDLDSAIANGRKYEKVYCIRAMIRRQLKDADGAIEDYRTAIGMRPDLAAGYVGLASIYLGEGALDKAAVTLEDFILTIESGGDKTGKVKGEVTAVSSVEIPALSNKNETVGQTTVIFNDEPQTRMNGAPSMAELDEMTDKLEQSKNTALAYFNLSQIYDKQQKYEAALAAVEKGLRIDPTDFFGYEMRGRIRLNLGDYEGALADLSKSIKMEPSKSIKYLDRGIAFLMLGKQIEAQNDFDKYLEFFPNNKETLDKRIEEAKQKLPR